MSARIKQPTGKKLNNGVKEGGVAGDKENKIIHSHHWEKLKQILNMQFQCYNFLIKLDQSRTKALKNRKGAKYSPWKSIYFTSRWKLCENLCDTTFCHIHRTQAVKRVWIVLIKVMDGGLTTTNLSFFFFKLHSSKNSAGHNGPLSAALWRRSSFVIT